MTRHITSMTIHDAEHYTPEQRAEIIASYPPHERDARTKGIPQLGSGRVFPIAEECIVIPPMQLPEWFVHIGGMDFGIDHPYAAVKLSWDRDDDVVYVVSEYRIRDQVPVIHAAAVKPWGDVLPWAWPHDGLGRDKGSGTALRDQYQIAGLNMLYDKASWPDGSIGVEAGLTLMLERMQTNRWKVFSTCTGWLEEFRTYHRKDGLVVKERDDLLCLHGSTRVVTPEGDIAIADLVGSSGTVLSSEGRWASYGDCRRTRRNTTVVRCNFTDGRELICTPDHLVLTDGGWIEAQHLQGHRVHVSIAPAESTEGACALSSSITSGRSSTAKSTAERLPVAATLATGENSFTAWCGAMRTAKSLPRTISTISMETLRTIRSRTWSASSAVAIFRSIISGMAGVQSRVWQLWWSGVRLMSAESFTDRLGFAMPTSCMSFASSNANVVASRSRAWTMASTDFAPTHAGHGSAELTGSITSTGRARSAAKAIGAIATPRARHAHGLAAGRSAAPRGVVCRKVSDAGRADVYCLDVPATQNFAVEGGLVVHNCASRYALMMMDRYATLSRHKRAFRHQAAVASWNEHAY